MSISENRWKIAAATVFVLASAIFALKKPSSDKKEQVVALIGDIGGTNIRLTLRRLDLKTRTSIEVKPLTKFASQEVRSIEEAVGKFIAVGPHA
jgi:hypothetical protein